MRRVSRWGCTSFTFWFLVMLFLGIRLTNGQSLTDKTRTFEFVPIVDAVNTNRLSGEVIYSFTVGRKVHKNSLFEVIRELESRHDQHETKSPVRETLNLLIRELTDVRNVATHQIVAFEEGTDNVVLLSKFYTDLIEEGMSGYGLIVTISGWAFSPTNHAKKADLADWRHARDSRIDDGRWAGAYKLGHNRAVLPGLRALDQLKKNGVP